MLVPDLKGAGNEAPRIKGQRKRIELEMLGVVDPAVNWSDYGVGRTAQCSPPDGVIRSPQERAHLMTKRANV